MIVLGHNTGDLSTELSVRPGRSLVSQSYEGDRGVCTQECIEKVTLGRLQRQGRWGLESHCHPKEECGAISGKSQGRRLLYVCHREHGPLDIFALDF